MASRDPDILPIKIDSTSNGEFRPVPVGRTVAAAKALAAARISENARRVNQSRRHFLAGLCGAATTLLMFDAAFAARGNTGGRFRLPPEAAFEPAAAAETLAGNEFIFDVQTHLVDPAGRWRETHAKYWEQALASFPQGSCGERDPVACFSADRYIREVFLNSDTRLAVLSFVPELPDSNPLTLEEADRTRLLVEQLKGSHRLLLHGMIIPNARPPQRPLEYMRDIAARWPIAAWKVYTQWGPEGRGWALDDPEIGIPFIETARSLGIRNICIHKGLSFAGFPEIFATCADVGRAARRFPDVNFIIYHSGFETNHREEAYDPSRATRGIDALVKSLHDNGIPPNANVYAELGSTWRFVMRDPTMAAHVLGKLLTHVGEERVLWGTDSIWYGSPQDQIQAFRAFQIAEPLIERHRYPPLTPTLKAKIFGLNGAALYGVDPATVRRRAEADPGTQHRHAELPEFETYGPRTDAEFDALLAERGGLPA
ncbi:MAG TPA: amidohydrolase family protein [Azospirillum sp.]|nr:amidohydrolase family protein [Azospirillum sp.]